MGYSPWVTKSRTRLSDFTFTIVPIFVGNVPLMSLIFLTRSLVFPIPVFLFLCIVHLRRLSYLSFLFFGTLHSNRFIISFLLYPLLLLFSQLFVSPLQTTILTSCISFSLAWFWSLSPVQCYEPPSIVTQALCLSDLIPLIYLSLPLYNLKGFDLGHI